MTPVELSRTVLRAVRRAVDGGELRVDALPEKVTVTVPGGGGWGDYATNVALQLARPAQQPPLRVAEILRPLLIDSDGVDDVVVTGPGFLNIRLRDTVAVDLVEDILRCGPRYGFATPTSNPASTSTSNPTSNPASTSTPTGTGIHTRPDPDPHPRISCPADLRSLVVMDVVARLLRAQGGDVRTRCSGGRSGVERMAVELGVRVDAYGDGSGAQSPEDGDLLVRVLPLPGDPQSLLSLGNDACRWVLLTPAPHDRVQVGDALAQRESNPLFRVRYAHARARALRRNALDLGFAARPGDVGEGGGRLLALLADHPRVLRRAAETRAPDRLARHLVAVADAALPFLVTVLPRGDEKPSAAHRARLALAEAAGAVLAGGLSLLGIDAPDHL